MTKTCLVTGASRGIGRATALYFGERGYNVVVCYHVEREQALDVVTAIGGDHAMALEVDIRDRDSVARMHDAVVERFGAIDVLVNNAGISITTFADSMTEAEYRDITATNIDGMHYVTQAFLPDMLSQKSGSIVNISSMWGVKGGSMEVAYSMTKSAVIGYTKALAREVGRSGIRVNAVAPGVIVTDMLSHLSEETLDDLRTETALDRLGTPRDIAGAVYYLASEEASFVTAQVLVVDGGMI